MKQELLKTEISVESFIPSVNLFRTAANTQQQTACRSRRTMYILKTLNMLTLTSHYVTVPTPQGTNCNPQASANKVRYMNRGKDYLVTRARELRNAADRHWLYALVTRIDRHEARMIVYR